MRLSCMSLTIALAVLGDGYCACAGDAHAGHPMMATTATFPVSDPGNSQGWVANPAFSDEFSGTALDVTKWQTNGIGWTGRQPCLFLSQNANVFNGELLLNTVRDANNTTIDAGMRAAGYNGYTSAEVNSIKSASYGYYEARIKAGASAASTAFWMAGQGPGLGGTVKTEIDIVEIASKLNGGTGPANAPCFSVHVWGSTGTGLPINGNDYDGQLGIVGGVCYTPGWDASTDYHVYGLDWRPNSIEWFVDGQSKRKWATADTKYFCAPMPLIFDSEIFTSWFGIPPDNTLPATIHVDYVRSWTLGGTPTPTPTPPPTPTPTPPPTPPPVTLLVPKIHGIRGLYASDPVTGTAVPGSWTIQFSPSDKSKYAPATASK